MTDQVPSPANSSAVGMDEYALVAYVPQPLGRRLDTIRRELSPWLPPGRSHVTVLSPRPLNGNAQGVRRQLAQAVRTLEPFVVETENIELFDSTGVIYLSVGRGFDTFVRLHHQLNRDEASFEEPVVFHPHITLARARNADEVGGLLARARSKWSDYQGNHSFTIDRLYFVQNTILNLWIDLEAMDLRSGGQRSADRRYSNSLI